MKAKTKEFTVPSASGGAAHKVVVTGKVAKCDCLGFRYRQTCRHIVIAKGKAKASRIKKAGVK